MHRSPDSYSSGQTPPSESYRKPGKSLARLLEKKPGAFLCLFTFLYAVGAVFSASRRRFGFDEIITTYLGDLADIRQIWSLIAKGIELNPPVPFWLAWTLQHTVGGGEVISRIPAIAGYWLMCFSLYHFVRRRCGIVYGFAALLLPIFTYPASDSAVARGYGLMLGASGLALLSWQIASDRLRRPLALAGISIAIATAISCHYYAVYVVGAIGIGEAVRTLDSKKTDWAVWIAIAAGLSPLAAYSELLRSASAAALKHFWISPMPEFLYNSYADLAGPTLMVLILLLILQLLSAGSSSAIEPDDRGLTHPGPHRHELAACFVLVAMPLAVYLAAVFGGVPFFTRYVQPVTIGYCGILTMFAHRIGKDGFRFKRLLIALLVWCCLLPWTLWRSYTFLVARPAAAPVTLSQLPSDSELPIVFDNESDFLETYYYGTPQVRSKIYNLVNLAADIRFQGSDTGLRSLALAQTFREVHCVDYRDFLASHREFLVARLHEEGWVVQSLLADGARMQLVSLKKALGFRVQATTVYHVVMPAPPG